MYGDTMVMRKRVAQLREQGEDIRSMADKLVSQSEDIAWTGRAADSLRSRVRDRASHLRDAANAHDSAASSLERHLTECDLLAESIDEISRKAESLIADAGTRVARADTEISDDDRALTSFEPPPPGHRDWLSIELPGL